MTQLVSEIRSKIFNDLMQQAIWRRLINNFKVSHALVSFRSVILRVLAFCFMAGRKDFLLQTAFYHLDKKKKKHNYTPFFQPPHSCSPTCFLRIILFIYTYYLVYLWVTFDAAVFQGVKILLKYNFYYY